MLGSLALLASPACIAAPAAGDEVTADFSGRLHGDFARFDNDDRGTPNPNDTEVRALWLGVSGKFFGFGYKAEVDLADLENGFSMKNVIAKDVYLSRAFGNGKLTLGQFKPHFTLDDRISSNDGAFMERSLFAQSVAPLSRLGAGWTSAGPGYGLAASLYSLESIDDWRTKGRGLAVRGTWAPLPADEGALHLGLSLARERHDHPGTDGAPALRVRPRPGGHLSDNSRATLIDYRSGRDVDVDKASAEFGWTHGPWYAQSEIGSARFDDGAQRGRIDSVYGQMSWLITGESRPYDAKGGRFGRVTPNGRYGAWELALRYDTMRGRQGDWGARVRDVSMQATTLGVNWYARPHLRFMLDWTRSRNFDELRARTLDRTDALTGRVQIDY